jgi:transposase
MVKKYYIGLDVHKKQTTYAVKDSDGKTIESGKCATQFEDLDSAIGNFFKEGEIIMEACNNYYHLYKKMKEKKIDVHVANVIHLRKIIGKNDRADAARLADMKRLNCLPESYIPDDKIQTLRVMINIYHGLIAESVRIKNQIHAVIDRNCINIPVSDPFTQKGLVCINQYLLENNDFALRNLRDILDMTVQRINNIESEIMGYIKNNFEEEYRLLKSIPGVGDTLVGYLIAEICPIERFINKRKLRRYAGVIPIREQSDDKIYATYIPKHASRTMLRYAIVLAANCAVRFENKLQKYYLKKKNGKKKNHGKAIMCVSSSLCDIIYNVLKTKKPYQK